MAKIKNALFSATGHGLDMESSTRNTLEGYRSQRDDLKQRLDNTNHFIDLIEKLKFEPKQVVMHKQHGPVIIRDYLVRDFNDLYKGTHHLVDSLPEDVQVGYIVVSYETELACTEDDLVAYTDTAKVLYD